MPREKATSHSDDLHSEGGRYRAPALEKGLDVLELLVAEATPLSMSEICRRLNRSQGEMFRMVQVLQSRGFVAQEEDQEGFRLTDKLFTMAMAQAPTKGLVEIALPHMRELAIETGQSCHLALHAMGDIVVVARMESNEQIGFSVRVGYRLPMELAVSGNTLFGFQPEHVRETWLERLEKTARRADLADFLKRSEVARRRGYARAPSLFVAGVTDISAPLLRGDRAAGALTVPFIKHTNSKRTMAQVTKSLVAKAAVISAKLVANDSRV